MTAKGIIFPDGNQVLADDFEYIVTLIEHHAKRVDPKTFKLLPVWFPEAARGAALYDKTWARQYTNTSRRTGVSSPKTEGNESALRTMHMALDVASPKPKNWTVCHLWGYDDPNFATGSTIVQDHRFYTCVANMIWLPSALKAFTDTVPQIKEMLRVCSYHMYGWVCEHPSADDLAQKIVSGWLPAHYPTSWPSKAAPSLLPQGISPISDRIRAKILDRKSKIREQLNDTTLIHYPNDVVASVLDHWNIRL